MKVFGSFTWLLHGIAAGLVSDEDMANGLFAFGCTRSHVVDPSGECDERTWVRGGLDGFAAHKKLLAIVLEAERTERVVWREPEDTSEDMTALLLQHMQEKGLTSEDCDWQFAPGREWRVKELEERLEADRLTGIKSLFEEAVELDRLRQFGGTGT